MGLDQMAVVESVSGRNVSITGRIVLTRLCQEARLPSPNVWQRRADTV